MKKLIFCTFGISLAFILQGWSFFKIFSKHEGPENGFVWYEVKDNGLYGAVDKDEKELLPCLFRQINLSEDAIGGTTRYNQMYKWVLVWDVVAANGDPLKITLYEFDDGWSYYETRNKKTEKVKISNEKYENVIIPYAKQDIHRLYKRIPDTWLATGAPNILKYHYFYVRNHEIDAEGIYNEYGAIIPVERKAILIEPYEQGNKAWYMYSVEMNGKYVSVVCDASGTELFRYRDDDCVFIERHCIECFHAENHKWYDWRITYDPEKGFGSLQEKYDNYGNLIDYYIKYTGIKLNKNHYSFDVKPSNNNEPAMVINLRTYTFR